MTLSTRRRMEDKTEEGGGGGGGGGELLRTLVLALAGITTSDDDVDIRESTRRSPLRMRDSRGRFPLHVAAACPWVDECILRALVKYFPDACHLPVDGPSSSTSQRQRCSLEYYRGKDLAVHILHRRIMMMDRPVALSFDSRHRGGNCRRSRGDYDDSDDERGGGGVGGGRGDSDRSSVADDSIELSQSASSRSSGSNGISYGNIRERLGRGKRWWRRKKRRRNGGRSDGKDDGRVENRNNHIYRGAISALLEPLVSAANDADGDAARLSCAATGSSSDPNTASTRDTRDGGNNDVVDDDDDDDDDEMNNTMVSSLHNSFYSMSARRNCTSSSPTTILLPLHIAAIHGVSHDILEGLCRAFPEGVATPMITLDSQQKRLPIELFEEGLAGCEVRDAPNDFAFSTLMDDYCRRSDLLFSYFPKASSSSTGRAAYCREEARLERFERLIRSEARHPIYPDGLLSDMAGSVWLFLCSNSSGGGGSGGMKSRNASTALPNFSAAIGRILDGLDPNSIQRLHYVRTTSMPEGVLVPPLGSGRTVLEEANERSSNGSLAQMLMENFFHSNVLSYLDSRDALSYSATCRRSWMRGVRLLKENVNGKNLVDTIDRKGSWKISDDNLQSEPSSNWSERGGKVSLPWQKLELPFVPSSTHTVFISCNITYQCWDERSTCRGGGLLVVGEDAVTNGRRKLVASSNPVRATAGSQQSFTSRVRFSFHYSPGHSYTLWYYGSESHILTVSNLFVKQLVYACDCNGHNPLHVLVSEGDNPSNLAYQLAVLVAAGFGSNLLVHYALKVGVIERTLRCLVNAFPTALLNIDDERRTPLHVAFDCPRMPNRCIVQALLTSSGVNAAQLKDSRGKLPIHIAAERGAGEELIRLLVDAYVDGCYRLTDDGDLPLHLLVRSGNATQVTVELLLRPIMSNPTICSYPGSLGINLPLHIASEYRCNYSIFKDLLNSYSEGAKVKRQLVQPTIQGEGKQGKKDARFALQIFEEGRGSEMKSGVGAQSAHGGSDFNLRSDLIFIHNPHVPKSTLPYLTTYFSEEKDRIERLAAVIKREASNCSQKLNDGEIIKLTKMAQLAWCWMCTNDHYTEVIKNIVRTLSVGAVRFLASTENPNSEPIPNTPIKECSTPRCSLILKSRLAFLGRYILEDRESSIIHKSESCVILRAKDIGAMDSFLFIQSLLDTPEPDIDDYSHGCGSVYGITGGTVEFDKFLHFARKIGLNKSEAIADVKKLLLDSSGSEDTPNLIEIGVKKSLFNEFCGLHSIDAKGCRKVVIKFMKSKQSFEMEKQCRDILVDGGKLSHFIPILNHFSFEGSDKGNSNDFVSGIFEVEPPLLDLSALRFGIVMPLANGDLRDILYREGINSSSLRNILYNVGESLQALHEQGITHGNLQLKKVLRYGQQMVLSDFGGAAFLKFIDGLNAIGGSSTKICPSILPPELIAHIKLSNKESFDRFMKYWSHVHVDAKYLRALTPEERESISHFVESCEISSDNQRSRSDLKSWKSSISSLLALITFEDLPPFLSKCNTLEQFCIVWTRMCENFNIWEYALRPHYSDDHCVYMVKSFENRIGSPPRDVSSLPYTLVSPSEKIDVWNFGIFMFELLSGGNPFHSGYRGDLRGHETYSRLYRWKRSDAERSVREHVHDPLAQDLLCKILLPADERLATISAVLKHPFFSPKSQEAERFLEKHEEMQLLRDNTITVRKVHTVLSRMIDDSMEKYCKIAFATDQIVFPCCLIALPYTLSVNESSNRPLILSDPKLISLAVQLGKCFLEINRATARMSFWLRMGAKMRGQDGNDFKSQMQEWLVRAKSEPCATIAREIVHSLDCGTNYEMICYEVLACDSSISKAKSYMRDPIRAARNEIKKHSQDLSVLYQSIIYLYLVDEVTMLPSCALRRGKDDLYPIRLDPNSKQIENVFIPFMNIVVMKALGSKGFTGLATLLGLPPNFGIHESWRSSEPGLMHNMNNSASIEEFVSLQRIVRNCDHVLHGDASSNQSGASASNDSAGNLSQLKRASFSIDDMDLSLGDSSIAGIPMELLELLFREHDPEREFNKMRRVTSAGQIKNRGLWTSLESIRQMQSIVEIAELGGHLSEWQLTLDRAKTTPSEYAQFSSRIRTMEKDTSSQNIAGEAFNPADVYDISPVKRKDEASAHPKAYVHEAWPKNECKRDHLSMQDPLAHPPHLKERVEISSHTLPHQTTPINPEDVTSGKKMRKSKRRFRPWFTAC
ncbi:LOW QUALITY PROTEIN: hypothetical protein ACHAXA_002886 [Cyclostephanos tholiformis]|uniref:Protein kinase domain-containing protein n=1 Tax=Cyclostephanos tholiformis TaxID=382380 RepID=A0ABD3SGD4_9STRA